MLKLSGISKIHIAGDVRTTALDRIDLEIAAGEYVAITGPSGCGKSTLLSVLGLLDVPTSGEYWFDGRNVAGWSEAKLNALRRGKIGFIFQSFNLIEELSVFENVELALEYTGMPAAERRQRVRDMLERLGVAHHAGHRPSQLSGGQQQRVAIARALVTRPPLILADEPTGNLDSATSVEIMKLLTELQKSGMTIVFVTHEPDIAAYAERKLLLKDGAVISDVRQKSVLAEAS